MSRLVIFASHDPFYNSRVVDALREEGNEVLVASSAQLVLELLDMKPCVIVTDGQLSHNEIFSRRETVDTTQTGLILARYLRKNHPELPVIINTSNKAILDECDEEQSDLFVGINRIADMGRKKLIAAIQRFITIANQTAVH